jgi:hypothetical protein
MHPQNYFPFIFFAFFAFVVGSFIYRIFKNGGFKAAMFGAPIIRTVGEVSASRSSRLLNVAVKVHILGGNSPDKTVGLEFVATSFASYQMMPVSLSTVEAKKLIMLLESATSGR